MPRILKSKKNILLCVLITAAIVVVFIGLWYVSLILVLIAGLMIINQVAVKENAKAKSMALSSKRAIHHWDTLLIGDLPTPKLRKSIPRENSIKIISPGRSIESSYQILLHTGSAIGSNDTVIILNDARRHPERLYTLFDIPYLGLVAKKEFGLEKLEHKTKYPILYEPFKTLQILLGIKIGDYVQKECPNKNFIKYCERKGFKLEYFEIS